MKSADKKELGKYLRRIADELGLRDWHFDMSVTEEVDEGALDYSDEGGTIICYASCMPTPGRKHASIKFHPEIREEKLEELRELVTHELVHCHFAALREIPRQGLGKRMSQDAYDIFMHAFDLEWEYAVDALARSFSMKMPLIKWAT